MSNISPASTEPSIGNIISSINNLSAEQIEQIVQHQKTSGLKFGEAAVALGFANRDQVLWALSQQFSYPYMGPVTEQVSPELVVASTPFDSVSEFFRDIRTQLLSEVFTNTDPAQRLALAVCSQDIGDGKSFFAANLAVALSQLGGRTLLVDADMRTPRQQEVFATTETNTGLSSILSGKSDVKVIRPIESLPNLYLLPVGIVPPNPLELVQGGAFDRVLAELRRSFEYVVVDTPANVHGADAKVIAEKCGAALVVARENITKVNELKKLGDRLQKTCRVFLGAVLNERIDNK